MASSIATAVSLPPAVAVLTTYFFTFANSLLSLILEVDVLSYPVGHKRNRDYVCRAARCILEFEEFEFTEELEIVSQTVFRRESNAVILKLLIQ